MDTRYFVLTATTLATALCLSTPARAAVSISGNGLQTFCTDFDRPTDPATCLGYVKGIANVLASGEAVDGYKACLTDTASDNRLVAIVSSYLEYARDRGRQPAAALVAKALAESYPCTK